MRALKVGAFLLLAEMLVLAQQSKPNSPPQSDPVIQALSHGVDHIDDKAKAPALQRRDPRYQIQSGDMVDLQFQFTPEFNQTATVQPDGYITLKEAGDLHVEGETLPELRQNLQATYAKILTNPVITVDLKDFEKPYFLAFGQLARPGKYDLRGNTTVSSAVAVAGGFTPQAKHSEVLLFRRVNDNWSSVTKIDLKHMLNSRNLNEDLSLHPGDMVYVPQNFISKVRSFIPNSTLGMYKPIP
jgi:polysaccharide export outer membrane protein